MATAKRVRNRDKDAVLELLRAHLKKPGQIRYNEEMTTAKVMPDMILQHKVFIQAAAKVFENLSMTQQDCEQALL